MREIKATDLIHAIEAGCRFDGTKFADHKGIWKGAEDHPPWILPFQAPVQRTSHGAAKADSSSKYRDKAVVDFIRDAENARARAIQEWTTPDEKEFWPRLRSSELFKALAQATCELAADPPNPFSGDKRLRMRTGLQLRCVEIIPDTAKGATQPLDLANGDFPFSLRLIACVVRVPLALSNLRLVTLELSGSSLVGVDASFIRTQGSVRLRRVFSNAPLDFGGAQIHGYFDAREALIQPFGKLPAGQTVDGERGMLNLSQASVDNEVRLGRATIWGGLAMRGLKTRRSISLDDADILSPLGVLEAMLFKLDTRRKVPPGTMQQQKVPDFEARPDELAARRKLKRRAFGIQFKDFLMDGKPRWVKSCLHVLINENMRVRTSALRADAVDVAGSIFARGLMAVGRVRLKYATVAGGLSLQGASLSSAERQRASFDSRKGLWNILYPIVDYRSSTYDRLVIETTRKTDGLAYGADDFALDLRESQFGGSVRVGTPNEDLRSKVGPVTEIDGVVALERAKIGGDLIFDCAKFAWTCRVPKKTKANPEGSSFESRQYEAIFLRDESVKEGECYSIEARGITIDGHFSLKKSTRLNGLNLDNSAIGGDLAFFDDMRRGEIDGHLQVTEAAHEIGGRVALAGTKIGGDCKVIFDWDSGPHLKAERVEVAGAITISAKPLKRGASNGSNADQPELDHFPLHPTERIRKDSDVPTLQSYREAAAGTPGSFREYEKQQRERPMIDLGNATASFFHHPQAAWPQVGRLLITGFKYRRALDYGPLAPSILNQEKISKIEVFIYSMFQSKVDDLEFFMLCFGLFLQLLSPYLIFIYTGQFNFWLFISMLQIDFLFRRISLLYQPDPAKTRPMAIAWLNLQTVQRNAFRTSKTIPSRLNLTLKKEGNIYHSLNPYVIATQALREEGRWISANFVEQRRIEIRDQQLSWRIHFAQKLFSKGLYYTSHYGFALGRPIKLMVVLIILAAMLAHSAGMNGAVTPRDEKPMAVAVAGTMAVAVATAEAKTVPPCDKKSDTPTKPCAQKLPDGFSPLIYATEVVVPGVGLKEESDWTVNKTASPFSKDSNWLHYWITYEALFFLLHLAGLALTSLLLIAVSTRLGSIFGSYKD